MSENINSTTELQKKRLDAMKLLILRAEKQNLKTREFTNEQMADIIRRIILNEAKKRY